MHQSLAALHMIMPCPCGMHMAAEVSFMYQISAVLQTGPLDMPVFMPTRHAHLHPIPLQATHEISIFTRGILAMETTFVGTIQVPSVYSTLLPPRICLHVSP